MQATVTTPVLSTAINTDVVSQPSTVVQHDTVASSKPSIKVGKLKRTVNVIAANDHDSAPLHDLAAMEKARISWESNELATSNKRLYAILQAAYRFYLEMKQNPAKDVRKKYADELNDFIKVRGYKFMPSTHDMTRVVKCVFGVDRRRVSAYSIALREALREEIDADDLIGFIEDEGGVEQVRLSGTKAKSVTDRAELAKSEVLSNELGLIKFDAASVPASADWTDKQVVIVATYMPTGEFQANAVLQHDGVVNTALAAFYSQKQQATRAEEKAARDAEKAFEAALQEEKRTAAKQSKEVKQKAAKAKKHKLLKTKQDNETVIDALSFPQ